MPSGKLDQVYTRITRNIFLLVILVLFVGLYAGWLAYFGVLTSNWRLDGSLGIFLGLYVCSHPAANMLDMLLFMKADIRESILSNTTGKFWLVLNVLAFLAGWTAIFIGAMRFVKSSF